MSMRDSYKGVGLGLTSSKSILYQINIIINAMGLLLFYKALILFFESFKVRLANFFS